jgi:RNA polymerase sigma factor (sigma-70 family)
MSVADALPTRTEERHARRKVLGARPRDDDAALVRRVQGGDEQAFAAIFKRHHAPLLSYCRHMLGNRDEGEDALQQAFIKAHQALLRGTVPRELRPWLYAIARNCCLSAIAARRPTSQLRDHTPALAGLSEEVHQREDLRELLAGIGRLPEDQRSALLLAELDDLSHQAIAAVVGCRVSKVKALIYQARTALIADRDACNTPCREIREELTVARGGELRRGSLRRHLKLCAGCRDFQLALGAQRESLACVLPVAPSAGLAAAVLGHAGAHAAGMAGIGGAGAGGAGGAGAGVAVVPAGGAAGTSAGVSTVGATTLGGGVVGKLAVGGAIAALAAAGTVAAHRRLLSPSSSRAAHARLASYATRGVELAGGASASPGLEADRGSIANDAGSADLGEASTPALTGAAGSVGSPVMSPFAVAASDVPGEQTLSMLTGTSTPIPPASTAQVAAKVAQGDGGKRALARARRARARLGQAALRRRALRLREARRRARLRKARERALRRAHRRVAPKPVKPAKPAVAPVEPAPTHRHRRKAAVPSPVTSTAVGTSTSEGNTTTKSKARGTRPTVSGTGLASVKTTGTVTPEPGTSAGKKAGSSTGKSKVASSGGSGEKSTTGASGNEASGTKAGKSGSEAGSGAAHANGGEHAGKASGGVSSSQSSEANAASSAPSEAAGASDAGTSSPKTASAHSKKHLLEAEQLPNL